MATIGTFTAADNGYTGSVKTLTLNVKAKFVATEKENDKAPDYRVFAGAIECSAAWKKTARESDREYLSVKLDDPSCGQIRTVDEPVVRSASASLPGV